MAARIDGMTTSFSFSGHETFPLRFNWLKKAVDVVSEKAGIFNSDEAIAEFGVGKNMVRSIKYWALATEVLESHADTAKRRALRVSEFGTYLLGDDGVDPYFEDTATLWLLHWLLCREPDRATLWHFVFGHWREGGLDLQNLQPVLEDWLNMQGGTPPASSTLLRDMQCLQNTYVARRRNQTHLEETVSCPLASLRLLYEQSGALYLRDGRQNGLPPEIFAYAVLDYWNRKFPEIETLSLQDVLTRRASPGQIFLLSEYQIFELTSRIERFENAPFRYNVASGLQQFYREPGVIPQDMLDRYYRPVSACVEA